MGNHSGACCGILSKKPLCGSGRLGLLGTRNVLSFLQVICREVGNSFDQASSLSQSMSPPVLLSFSTYCQWGAGLCEKGTFVAKKETNQRGFTISGRVELFAKFTASSFSLLTLTSSQLFISCTLAVCDLLDEKWKREKQNPLLSSYQDKDGRRKTCVGLPSLFLPQRDPVLPSFLKVSPLLL